MKQIIIDIGDGGEVTIEAVGFKGGACEKATEAIEKAIGVSSKKIKKPEFYQQEQGKQSVG